MINIRYHIVSITAVFLALGIGVALGSTFLDKATVNVLDSQITSAENRIKATNEENDRLNQQVSQSRERDASLILVGSEPLLADQLTDIPVLLIVAPGVDNDAISVMQEILLRSSADYRATVELSDKLDFTDGSDNDLATDLDLTDPDPLVLRSAVNASLTNALLAAGTPLDDDGTTRTESTATTTTSTVPGLPADCCTVEPPEGDEPAAVTVLRDRGYLEVSPGPDYTDDDPILETTGYRYVYLGGPELEATQNQVLLNLLPADGPAMPATVVSATQPPPAADEEQVPTVVASVRANDELVSRYNTVDETQTFAGLVATIFTLRDMGVADPGQYGQAEGATSVLPPS